ncbi:hypothetical protein J2X55_003458 [Microbacterium sp. 1154]|uniref:hypothetical protein n=1 Tax=Microbacterium sp. 1154 TaxID=2817733 RepID=UPI00285D62C7|nr:hypothetical protein [Microbacterium sp. 1154]MDR6692513.1 hypothetical protein [Microbacterium sp. 1154]
MTNRWVPRFLDTVLVETTENSIVVTWGLGEPIPNGAAEFSGYGVYYYDPTGNGGKRLGVRFSQTVPAHIFDNASATHSNYGADAVRWTSDAVVVTFNDASLGLDQVGTIAAFSHVDGRDVQVDFPVTLLR